MSPPEVNNEESLLAIKQNIKQLQTIVDAKMEEIGNGTSVSADFNKIKELAQIRENLFSILNNEYTREINKLNQIENNKQDSETLLEISKQALQKKKKI